MLTHKSVTDSLGYMEKLEAERAAMQGKLKLLVTQRDTYKHQYEAQKTINDALLDVLCDLFNRGRELNDVY